MSFQRLIQLTDLHITANESISLNGVNPRQSFLAVLQDALNLQPDYMLLTGDIVSGSHPQGYAWVKRFMQKTGVAWSWLPGNHDTVEFMQDKFLRKVELGQWRLLQLNSQVKAQSYGALNEQELKLLQSSLAEDSATPTLIMVHHHVCEVGSCLDDGRIDSARLFQCLHDYPCVKAIVHGHIHQQWASTQAHMHILGTPSTCVQFLPGAKCFLLDCKRWPGYRTFDLFPDGSWVSEIRRVRGHALRANASIPTF